MLECSKPFNMASMNQSTWLTVIIALNMYINIGISRTHTNNYIFIANSRLVSGIAMQRKNLFIYMHQKN